MDLFRWMDREARRTVKRVEKAFSSPCVKSYLLEHDLTKKDLEEADRRIQLTGIGRRAGSKALHDTEILAELFNRLSATHELSFADYLEWSVLLIDRYGSV